MHAPIQNIVESEVFATTRLQGEGVFSINDPTQGETGDPETELPRQVL
jgi:hypothetical protein